MNIKIYIEKIYSNIYNSNKIINENKNKYYYNKIKIKHNLINLTNILNLNFKEINYAFIYNNFKKIILSENINNLKNYKISIISN